MADDVAPAHTKEWDSGDWKVLYDHFWKLHEEHMENSRHQEDLRTSTSTLVLTLASALIAVGSVIKDGAGHLVICLLVPVLGVFGMLFTLRHHERSRFFQRNADLQREAAQEVLRWRRFLYDSGALFGAANTEHGKEPLGTSWDPTVSKQHRISKMTEIVRETLAVDRPSGIETYETTERKDAPVAKPDPPSDASKKIDENEDEPNPLDTARHRLAVWVGQVIGGAEIWWLWAFLHLLIVAAGIVLTVNAAIGPSSIPAQSETGTTSSKPVPAGTTPTSVDRP